MAAGSACLRSTGLRISAAPLPSCRRRRFASSMPRCRRSGRARTPSISWGTPLERATRGRSRSCSTVPETPPSLPAQVSPDIEAARRIVQRVLEQKRTWLDPLEIADLLNAYSIPITPVLLARDADEAARAAAPLLAKGGTVVVKILSPDI